ncbi:MAG: T9SS type A sorting domain-containing protein [Flavobacteriales bacterium]|nr:T9SS type A sorting domain-containing protein [Flavobacteriales bacterium]
MTRTIPTFTFLLAATTIYGQSLYIPIDSLAPSILSYTLSGGSMQSYGCDDLDPTYWISGGGATVSVNFVDPQPYPSFRVWGMNDDDSASVMVNGLPYPLSLSTAAYDEKVICDTVFGSPGPDGVVFEQGLLVGANTPGAGNYSYQNVTLLTTDVNSFTVMGVDGAGWGIDGVTIGGWTGLDQIQQLETMVELYPNPVRDVLTVSGLPDTDVRWEMLDLQGRTVMGNSVPGTGTLTLDLEALPKGLYLLKLGTPEGTVSRKVQKW